MTVAIVASTDGPAMGHTLRERAKAAYDAAERGVEAATIAEQERLRVDLAKAITKAFGKVPDVAIAVVDHPSGETAETHATHDGMTFSLRWNPFSKQIELHVLSRCARGCGLPLWVPIDSVSGLGCALYSPMAHPGQCPGGEEE